MFLRLFLLRCSHPVIAPAHKESPMDTKQATFTTAKVSPSDAQQAQKLVTEYRDNGNGSNRANWARVTALLAVVLTVIRTGKSVDVSDLFPVDGSDKVYHTAHRALSHGAIRPYWHNVAVVGMRNVTATRTEITGETTTTRATHVVIAPVA